MLNSKKTEIGKPKKTDKKVLSFFLIGFPTILIVALAMIIPGDSWWVMILLSFYQFVMLKQFLDNYYDPIS